mgnify:CR=1 FL=1
MVVSNDALSALDWFRIDTTAEGPGKTGYNDVVRWMYDALYKMNVEVDFIEPLLQGYGSVSDGHCSGTVCSLRGRSAADETVCGRWWLPDHYI